MNISKMMKKSLFFVVGLLLALSVYADEPISFASWNLRYANAEDSLAGNGWSKRIVPISNVIRYNDIDIVNLQEMNGVDSISMTDMLLEKLPGYAAVTCGDSVCRDFNPIVYKDEIRLLDKGVFWFAPDPGKAEKGWDAMLRRYCTWAKFEKNGYPFFVFNVHWDHKGAQARHESALLSVRMVKELAMDNPVFFAGDLNCRRKYDCYYLLKDEFWRDAREDAVFVYLQDSTFNRFNVKAFGKNIDHVFVTNDIRVLRYGVTKEIYFDGEKWRYASDHNPIIVFAKLTKK